MWMPAGQRIGDVHRLDPLGDGAVEPHRARDAELAGVGPGARDDVVDLVRAGLAEAELVEPPPDVVDRLVADPAQHEVLVHGRARVAAGELAHDVGQAAELLGRRGRRASTLTWTAEKPSWRWASTFAARKRRNSVRSPFGEPGATGGSGAPASSSCRNSRSPVEKSRSATQSPLQLLLDLLAHRLDADLVDHHLEAGARAVDAQPVLAVEDPQDGLGVLEVLAVVGAHEVDQRRARSRGMIDVPPPIRISKPLTPSRSRAMKATSWMPVSARSVSEPVNAVLTLRGISCVVGWRTK